MKEWFVFDSVELVLLMIVVCALLCQFIYHEVMTFHPVRKLVREQTNCDVADSSFPSVSVIVYADKRSDQLRVNLPHILEQDYPDFEVVVVNDGADPDVKDVITFYQNDYSSLHSTYIPLHTQYVDHKKLALTLGIKAAKHDVLLFTEADCCPVSKDWISSMMRAGVLQGKSFVLGNSHYVRSKGLLYQLTAYAALKKYLRSWSSLFTRTPFLDDGRNMVCRKSVLLDNHASVCGIDLRVGKSELLSAGLVSRENVTIAMSPESAVTITSPITRSSMKENLLALMGLKRYYRGASLFVSRLVAFFNILMALVFVVLSVYSVIGGAWGMIGIVLSLLTVRYGYKLVALRKASSLLQQPLRSVVHPYWEFLLQTVSLFGRFRSFFVKE